MTSDRDALNQVCAIAGHYSGLFPLAWSLLLGVIVRTGMGRMLVSGCSLHI
jgi:hypothetical protein